MKITSCKPIALTVPFIHPRSTPDDPDNGVRNCVWLCIETDEGVRGWGEVYAGCYATEVALAALRRLIRCLPGLDPLDPHAACRVDGVIAMECPQIIHAPRTDPLPDIWRIRRVRASANQTRPRRDHHGQVACKVS